MSERTIILLYFKSFEEVIPKGLTDEFSINNDYWNKCGILTFEDLSFIIRHFTRYFFSTYFIFKSIIRLSKYSFMIKHYASKAIVTHSEYSFCSSLFTSYANSRNVEHINVMHREKLYFIRDSLFHFNRCYVWHQHYIDLMKSLKAEEYQFIVALPASMRIDLDRYNNKSYYADYKYYLAIYDETQIRSIVQSMNRFKERGFTIKYRPHPRYSDISLLRKYLHEDEIEYADKVSILSSVASLEYAVGLYTTVLSQAYFSGKSVALDNITYIREYKQLKDLRYFLCRAYEIRKLSSFYES